MQNLQVKIKILIKLFINNLVKIITVFIKKDSQILIIGGWFGERFADNSKYLYLYLNENKEKYNLKKIIWITKSKSIKKQIEEELKYEVYMKWSLKSIYYHLKSKYHIIDQSSKDILDFFSVGAIKINLWHGMPLKKIGAFMKNATNFKSTVEIGNWNKKYILSCSKFGAETIGKAFCVNRNKMINGMYPRNYYLINNNEKKLNIEKKYLEIIKKKKRENKKIILYLPTFRDNRELIFLGEKNEKKLKIFFKFLNENNYFLVTKLHFAGDKIINKGRDKIENTNKEFLNLSSELDVYSILRESDILITDYSSVYFDFLYLDKDIIFYPYDLIYYRDEDRGLMFEYSKMTPGDKVYTLEELKENLKTKCYQRDSYKEERKKLLELCFENYTIEDTVKNILNIEVE